MTIRFLRSVVQNHWKMEKAFPPLSIKNKWICQRSQPGMVVKTSNKLRNFCKDMTSMASIMIHILPYSITWEQPTSLVPYAIFPICPLVSVPFFHGHGFCDHYSLPVFPIPYLGNDKRKNNKLVDLIINLSQRGRICLIIHVRKQRQRITIH